MQFWTNLGVIIVGAILCVTLIFVITHLLDDHDEDNDDEL